MKSSVLGIIFSEDRKEVLVLKRRDVPMWVFPGGGIDERETPEAAVIREIYEETGFKAEIVRKIGEYTPANRLTRFTFLFECRTLSGEPSIGNETREVGFYPIDNLPQPFFIIHQNWLQDALLNETEVLKKPVPGVTYWNFVKYFLRHPVQVIRLALSRLGFPINKK